ncbi:hypothetical protein COUCH_04850 [Couchioplanes caeruleus]|uniref:hypothetical protein n=1 Tax=Couchioplanes caeruleus TaxID=56438 RepID=UPI0020BFD879|nr:hypothetical protein [Couchioplanes caeruleus]UQU65657.1 hypothetical protein COUCH_04850 [Couchioplanes caeruleus]
MTDTLRQLSAVAEPAGVTHRPSHRQLMIQPGPDEPGDVSAIVVPTNRHAVTMRDSLRLAEELQRPLVALCSQWSSAAAVLAEAAKVDTTVIAVDVTGAARLPAFSADQLIASARGLTRVNDVSVKRNTGLAAARMLRWARLAFLDDDITDLRPDAVKAAGGLLRKYNVAALENVGFPDNSVVCHARREVGMPQDSFVGGGAMAVRVNVRTPFFPSIYNEDWFFLVGRRAVERVAVCGKVSQREYDPYLSPERARSEEFGDCLAEGLFALSGQDRPAGAADEAYWRAFLDDRILMIDDILGRLAAKPPTERRHRMAQALRVARGRCRIIDPAFCVRYLAAWRADLDVWKRFLTGLPVIDDPVAAFAHLGLKAYVHPARGRRPSP